MWMSNCPSNSFPMECFWYTCWKSIKHKWWGFISGLLILFHWSIHLSLCQYHTVLIKVTLYYFEIKKCKSSYFFLKIILATPGFLKFQLNLSLEFQFIQRSYLQFWMGLHRIWSSVFRNIAILNLLVHGCGLLFDLFISYLISFNNVCSFQCMRFVLLSDLFLSYFIIFDAIANENFCLNYICRLFIASI